MVAVERINYAGCINTSVYWEGFVKEWGEYVFKKPWIGDDLKKLTENLNQAYSFDEKFKSFHHKTLKSFKLNFESSFYMQSFKRALLYKSLNELLDAKDWIVFYE